MKVITFEQLNDLREEVYKWSRENSRQLFGFSNVIELEVYTQCNYEKQAYEAEVRVNWSAVGSQTTQETKKFLKQLEIYTAKAAEFNSRF